MKRLSIILFSVGLIQFLTYGLFSEDKIHYSIIANQSFSGFGNKMENFTGNLKFVFALKKNNSLTSLKLSEPIRLLYLDKYSDKNNFEIVDDFDSLNEVLNKKGILTCLIEIEFQKFYCMLSEDVISYSDNEVYVESFETKYIWILFGWFNLGRVSTGIS